MKIIATSKVEWATDEVADTYISNEIILCQIIKPTRIYLFLKADYKHPLVLGWGKYN